MEKMTERTFIKICFNTFGVSMEMHILRLTQTLQVTSSILVQVLHVCHMDSAAGLDSHLAYLLSGLVHTNVLENRRTSGEMEL